MKPLFSSYHLEGIIACAAGADPKWRDPACRSGVYLGEFPSNPAAEDIESVVEATVMPIDPASVPEIPDFKHILPTCFQGGRDESLETIAEEQLICLATMSFEPKRESHFLLSHYEPGDPAIEHLRSKMADPAEAFGYCCERALLEEIGALLDNLGPIGMALAKINHGRLQDSMSRNKSKRIALADPDPSNHLDLTPFNWSGNSYRHFAPPFLAGLEQKKIGSALPGEAFKKTPRAI